MLLIPFRGHYFFGGLLQSIIERVRTTMGFYFRDVGGPFLLVNKEVRVGVVSRERSRGAERRGLFLDRRRSGEAEENRRDWHQLILK